MKKRLSLAAAALALVASLVPNVATAQTTPISVQLGAGLGRDVPGFTARPMVPVVDGIPTVYVRSGDTIHLRGAAILLPEGQDPDEWREQVATTPGDPWALVYADPDADLPGVNAPVHLNPRSFGPTHFDCGFSADDPCEFDGSDPDPVTGAVNSGDQGDWWVTITGQPNDTYYGVSQLFLEPAVDFRIVVVNPSDPVTTQAELDAAKADLRAQDRNTALSAMETLNRPNRYQEDGKTIVEIHAGYDQGPIAMFAFFPQQVRIRQGDTVRYLFDHATLEPHTATLPKKAGNKTAHNAFVPACDPDGEGPGPDTEAAFSEDAPPCPDPDQFELDLGRRLTAQIGDGVFPSPRGRYESSGLRGAIIPEGLEGLAGGMDPWDVRFNRTSSEGFDFVCALHGGFMSGTVKVR